MKIWNKFIEHNGVVQRAHVLFETHAVKDARKRCVRIRALLVAQARQYLRTCLDATAPRVEGHLFNAISPRVFIAQPSAKGLPVLRLQARGKLHVLMDDLIRVKAMTQRARGRLSVEPLTVALLEGSLESRTTCGTVEGRLNLSLEGVA